MEGASQMDFHHPCNILVAGPTNAGKTELVKRIIKHASLMFIPPPVEIWWCYGVWQPSYHSMMDEVKFLEGIPPKLREDTSKPLLLVLDDLMQDVKEKNLSKLFTRETHHGNISCIHIVQNIFYQGMRTSRVNAQYIFLLKNPSDKLQVGNLGRQLFPKKSAYFLEAFEDACAKPFGYLTIDLSQETPENFRLRTKIFPGENHIVYVPKV